MAERGRRPELDEDALDALDVLEERLRRATEAAERLLAQAREGGDDGRGGGVPLSGWRRRGESENPGGDGERPPGAGWIGPDDLELLLTGLATVLDLVPADLQRRVLDAWHELLLAVRALVEWCSERLQRRRCAPVATEVQDIPIL